MCTGFPKGMEHLPADVVALLPLDKQGWAALAATSQTMRDLVAWARCVRGVTLHERWAYVLDRPTYQELTSLCVLGPWLPCTAIPSPPPLLRRMPFLRRLELTYCRPSDAAFWAGLVDRAPRLESLVVNPLFLGATYAGALRSCVGMMHHVARLPNLARLEVRGDGLSSYPHRADAMAAAREVREMQPVRLSFVKNLVITGRQFCPAIDAPLLENASIEESDDPSASFACRIRSHTLRELDWRAPPHKLPLPPRFHGLESLRVCVRDIRYESTFASVMRDLAHLPATLTRLRLDLDFQALNGEDPTLPYCCTPLRSMHCLHSLHVRISFPSRGVGTLVTGLLGAPPASLRDVLIDALGGPADRLRNVLWLMQDDGADPDWDDLETLRQEIAEIEEACRLRDADVQAALHNYPGACFVLRGFSGQFTRHSRVVTYRTT